MNSRRDIYQNIQKKMKQVKVNVGNKSYICDLLESEEDRRKGLMGVENLP